MSYMQAVSIMAPILILIFGCTGSYVLLCADFYRARAVTYFSVRFGRISGYLCSVLFGFQSRMTCLASMNVGIYP